MTKDKRKFIIFLIAILGMTKGATCLAQPNNTSSISTQNQQSETVDNDNKTWQIDPNSTWNFSKSADNKELFSSAAKAIIIVVILCIAIIVISKKLLPKISTLSGRRIQIIETIHLAPKKSLHLIKVDDRQILIGSTNDNITKLAELTDILNNPFESQSSDIEENNDQPNN